VPPDPVGVLGGCCRNSVDGGHWCGMGCCCSVFGFFQGQCEQIDDFAR